MVVKESPTDRHAVCQLVSNFPNFQFRALSSFPLASEAGRERPRNFTLIIMRFAAGVVEIKIWAKRS
jgi:hypothetical protein